MAINFDKIQFDHIAFEPCCPCVLLLDTSSSMSGDPIDQLNKGIQVFKDALAEAELAMMRVEVAVVSFGGSVSVVQDFIIAYQFTPSLLQADGGTPMGQAINDAFDLIDARKQVYRANGIPFYRPWIFMVTAGAPTDGDLWKTAAQRVKVAEKEKKVAFFAVGVESANMPVLQQISERAPLKLQGLNFREMFLWLSRSLTSVTQKALMDEAPVHLQSPMGWATV